ncbi:hypothetical protein L596_021671 [Steinernema carpocapsae]|uniref:HAT C-terminal dimerisation domain-containing protein n=1 Tax=Steinernema carpocapsae TaxID=34508 RepID=A0A4U5MK95_STECR|nr:hypothetical protein L596_021671 [Steinernema carpocapsae]
MIERFVENRSVVNAFLMDRKEYPQFYSGDYLLLEKILQALKPIKDVTVVLQGNLLAPVEGIETDPNFVIATLLDVRFKRDFIETERKEEATASLLLAAEKFLDESTERSRDPSPSPTMEETNNLSLFEKYRASEMVEEHLFSPPLNEKLKVRMKFLAEPAQVAADPIQYWHRVVQSGNSLILGQMAKKYLCALATSVESERLFSTAALTLTDLRKSMTVENLQKLLLLKCNVPLERYFPVP